MNLPLSHTLARRRTDSKRIFQLVAEACGSLKSLRYQAVPPPMLALLKSPVFQAFGTVTLDQPAAERLRWKPLRSPWFEGSRRNSQLPFMRKRPVGPSWAIVLAGGAEAAPAPAGTSRSAARTPAAKRNPE